MSALLKKELRLLRSAWIAAILLLIAPTMLARFFHYDRDTALQLTFCAWILGCAILGVAGFGWEFEFRTFSMLLAQPRQRRQFWRAKIGALLVTLLLLGLVAIAVGLSWEDRLSWHGKFDAVTFRYALLVLAAIAAAVGAVTTSGLWTTLLLRQIFGSIVFSIIAPLALVLSVTAFFDEQISDTRLIKIVIFLLTAHSVAGYLLAHWLFRTAQDTQWTGGNLSLSGILRRLRRTRATAGAKKSHPLWALFAKEIHLHESSLLVAGLLLLLQLVAYLLSWFSKNPNTSVLGVLPQMIWMLWLLMPALVGCSAVAEERKLGILESQLCLPISRARQFMVKATVTMMYGIVLGAAVPMLTLPLSRIRGAQMPEFAYGWTLACIGITVIGFYASSLARQMLQALGVGVAFVAVWAFLLNWLNGEFAQKGGYFTLFGGYLWRGLSVFIIGALVMVLFALGHTLRRCRWLWIGMAAPCLLALYLGPIRWFFAGDLSESSRVLGLPPIAYVTVAFMLCPLALALALAYLNFKHFQVPASLWLRNATTWAGCLFVTMIVTALVYNRVWEFGKQFEPPAGPPQLDGPVRPVINGSSDESPTFVLLPDGRLCWFEGVERIVSIVSDTTPNQPRSYETKFRAIENPRINFVADSNWVTIAKSESELVGIKSDGSLWSASLLKWISLDGTSTPRFERIGSALDWKAVAAGQQHVVALKRDGTIWGWASFFRKESGESLNPITDGPVRIGHDTDWTNVFAGFDGSFGIKQDGGIWKWGGPAYDRYEKIAENIPMKMNLSVKGVRTIISEQSSVDYDLILDETGSLWGLGTIPWYLIGLEANRTRFKPDMPCQLPIPSSTAIAAAERGGIAGISADGRLWNQDADDLRTTQPTPVYREIGRRTDWIAVMIDRGSILALARDGTICRFGEPIKPSHSLELLAPLRRVTWSANVLDGAN